MCLNGVRTGMVHIAVHCRAIPKVMTVGLIVYFEEEAFTPMPNTVGCRSETPAFLPTILIILASALPFSSEHLRRLPSSSVWCLHLCELRVFDVAVIPWRLDDSSIVTAIYCKCCSNEPRCDTDGLLLGEGENPGLCDGDFYCHFGGYVF